LCYVQHSGDWLDNLPKTREWFNQRLQTTFFPLLTHLFPEIVSSPSILRAHAVSLLKYNATHPRTDVHIDNGILAMTLAMTPRTDYVGGGTFFEHMGVDHVVHMDVGHGTFRPGSVRHGGHRVTDGTRYILGAFLLLEDKVEHVRRLKNRGSALRRKGDLDNAARHFEWALALNPKCTTCLKDWAEILLAQKKFVQAEQKLRSALELLENKDSDALFNLGVVLSEQGRDNESIQAYLQSVEMNSEDAELCFNLGVKFGAKGEVKKEMEMYERAIHVDPKFGPAWLNWGTALAEAGKLDEVSTYMLELLPLVVFSREEKLTTFVCARGDFTRPSSNFSRPLSAVLMLWRKPS
jgi:tetratricopeptide (TPR) repeat protein